MILGDVVEVVRDGLAHVEARIGPEIFEDGHGGRRIGDEFDKAEGPRQPRAAALAGEAADVLVRVLRPAAHDAQGASEISFQKFANGKFR